jgi:hypothetical protein
MHAKEQDMRALIRMQKTWFSTLSKNLSNPKFECNACNPKLNLHAKSLAFLTLSIGALLCKEHV